MATELKNLMGYASSGIRDSIYHAYNETALVAEKIEEWNSFKLFLEYNPDIKERYAVFKTYEILKNGARNR